MKKQAGFTLIELIIVIVILGILAAYAIPKYISIDREARISVTKGLEGSIRAAADMVHAIAVAKGQLGTAGSVDVGTGTSVAVAVNGYPTGIGINDALSDTSGFTVNPTATATLATYQKTGAATVASCQVVYSNAGTANTIPTITPTITGC